MWFRPGDVCTRRFVFSEEPVKLTETKPRAIVSGVVRKAQTGTVLPRCVWCCPLFRELFGLIPQHVLTVVVVEDWHCPLSSAQILYAPKHTMWDIVRVAKTLFGLWMKFIWRQIFPATSLSLLIPMLPSPSCPSGLAAGDAGGQGVFVPRKTKLRWLIRTRHAWLSAYQRRGGREEKHFLSSTQAPAGQLERAGGWWFCCKEALPPPSAASQAGLTGPGEQGSTTNTPQRDSCPPFHPFPCSFLVSPWSVPLAGSGAWLGCPCPVSDAAVTPRAGGRAPGQGSPGPSSRAQAGTDI